MKFFRLMLMLTIVFLTLWGGGLLWFKSRIAAVGEANATHADAIVVLTGGTMRLRQGLDLLKEGYAKKMLISGVAEGVTLAELLQSRQEPWPEDGALTERIAIGYKARDTWENAQETARWIDKNQFTSALLVTSNYHMPRAMLEFWAAMPEVEVTPYPVVPGHVKLDEWWRHPGTRKLILTEYHKFLGVSLRLVFRWRAT